MPSIKSVGKITQNTEIHSIPKLVPVRVKMGNTWVRTTGYVQSNGKCLTSDGLVHRFGQWRYVTSVG
jgi:hypothetical protein